MPRHILKGHFSVMRLGMALTMHVDTEHMARENVSVGNFKAKRRRSRDQSIDRLRRNGARLKNPKTRATNGTEVRRVTRPPPQGVLIGTTAFRSAPDTEPPTHGSRGGVRAVRAGRGGIAGRSARSRTAARRTWASGWARSRGGPARRARSW